MVPYKNVSIGLGALSIALIVILVLVFFSPSMFNVGAFNTNNREVESLKQPNLVNVGIGAADLGSQPPYEPVLHVSGWVVNTGTDTAYNTKLHIVAYFISGAKAIDTQVPIGTGVIHGSDSVHIDLNVTYSSSGTGGVVAQTATITPVWTDSP